MVAPQLRQEAVALLVLMALPSKVAAAQIRVNVPQVVVAVAAATSVVVVVAIWENATTVAKVALATRGRSALTMSTVVLTVVATVVMVPTVVALVVVAQRTQMEVSQSQSCAELLSPFTVGGASRPAHTLGLGSAASSTPQHLAVLQAQGLLRSVSRIQLEFRVRKQGLNRMKCSVPAAGHG
jgi:hypothetical protein